MDKVVPSSSLRAVLVPQFDDYTRVLQMLTAEWRVQGDRRRQLDCCFGTGIRRHPKKYLGEGLGTLVTCGCVVWAQLPSFFRVSLPLFPIVCFSCCAILVGLLLTCKGSWSFKSAYNYNPYSIPKLSWRNIRTHVSWTTKVFKLVWLYNIPNKDRQLRS